MSFSVTYSDDMPVFEFSFSTYQEFEQLFKQAFGRKPLCFGKANLFPTIIDVDIKKDSHGDNRVVIATFDDGTTEKAVTSDNDTFNLEQGVQICIAKKAFSMLFDNGSGLFNKLVNNTVKLYNSKVTASEKAKEEALRQEARAKKRAEKKAKWLERKKVKERESRVNEMAEAYAKAMKMINEESKNK